MERIRISFLGFNSSSYTRFSVQREKGTSAEADAPSDGCVEIQA